MTIKTDQREHVNFWLEPKTVRLLDEKAEKSERSRSAELRLAVRAHLGSERDSDDRREEA